MNTQQLMIDITLSNSSLLIKPNEDNTCKVFGIVESTELKNITFEAHHAIDVAYIDFNLICTAAVAKLKLQELIDNTGSTTTIFSECTLVNWPPLGYEWLVQSRIIRANKAGYDFYNIEQNNIKNNIKKFNKLTRTIKKGNYNLYLDLLAQKKEENKTLKF